MAKSKETYGNGLTGDQVRAFVRDRIAHTLSSEDEGFWLRGRPTFGLFHALIGVTEQELHHLELWEEVAWANQRWGVLGDVGTEKSLKKVPEDPIG